MEAEVVEGGAENRKKGGRDWENEKGIE